MIEYIYGAAGLLLCGLSIKIIYKIWGPSILNTYDDVDIKASLKDYCIFCKLVHENNKAVYEDEQVIAFNDLYPRSPIHILIIPKRHIKDLYHLKENDLQLLEHMKEVSELLKSQLSPSNDMNIGFHHPIITSVQHLHLHVLSLPYTNPIAGSFHFNSLFFIRINDSIAKFKQKFN